MTLDEEKRILNAKRISAVREAWRNEKLLVEQGKCNGSYNKKSNKSGKTAYCNTCLSHTNQKNDSGKYGTQRSHGAPNDCLDPQTYDRNHNSRSIPDTNHFKKHRRQNPSLEFWHCGGCGYNCSSDYVCVIALNKLSIFVDFWATNMI